MTDRRRFPHLPALDGLRAVAVTAVLAFHAGLLRGGWLGVELFFVLSGYLICSILVTEYSSARRVDLVAFWGRRARRLLPAVAVLLSLLVVLAALDQIVIRSRGVIGAVTYSTNWLQIFGKLNYWDAFAVRDPAEHLWSLAIEEQVYLLFPVLLYVVRRRWGIDVLANTIAALAGVSWAVAVYGVAAGWPHNRLYLGTDTRCAAFLCGAAAALLLSNHRHSDKRLRRPQRFGVGIAAGALLIALIWLPGDSSSIFRGPLAAVDLCAALVVVGCRPMRSGPLVSPPMQALGRWSYGIYVFHWPLNQSRAIAGLNEWVRFVVVFALSTALAALSYWLIEQPIRLRRVSRPILGGLAVAGTGVAAVALIMSQSTVPVLASTGTLAPRTPFVESTVPTASSGPGTSTSTSMVKASEPMRPASSVASNVSIEPAVPAVTAVTSAPNAGLRVAVFGDSVPALAANELVAIATEQNILIDVYGKPGCTTARTAADAFGPDVCLPYLESLSARAEADDPDVVVLWWGGTGGLVTVGGKQIGVCTEAGRHATDVRYEQLISSVTLPGQRVVVVTQAPRTDLDEESAIGTVCANVSLRSAAARLDAAVIDLGQQICPDYPSNCARIPRRDGMHFTAAGARQAARYLFDEIRRITAG